MLASETPVRRLHLGGVVRSAGWEVLNAVPGDHVDHLGDAGDLSRFADNTFAALYASHLLEHFDYKEQLERVLGEWRRVLSPGGTLYLSVPDLDVLCRLFLDKTNLSLGERFFVMRMIIGGHIDEHDYHQVGLNEEFLTIYLRQCGFVGMERVDNLGLFDDTSTMRVAGVPISVNMRAYKP